MAINHVEKLGYIQLPNNESLIPALLDYAGRVARDIGFSEQESSNLQLIIEEACMDVIKNAFAPHEEAEFDITFLRRLDGIEIRVHDMGLPYDPNMAPAYHPVRDLEQGNLDGLGSFLIRQFADEYRFNNLGIKGKEVVLIKYFASRNVIEEHAAPSEPEVVRPPEEPAEAINFDIRLMKTEEALEICRCIYDCYGYSYANENIYYPERVVAMNREGQLRSAVAVTPDGEMGGHFALIYYDHLPAEIGIAVTKKKFRGQGFARQLGEFLEAEARREGLHGLQVKEVTAHPYTQKFCRKLGYKDCGLLLAHSPKTLSFKGIADTLKQRNSDVLGFKYLREPGIKKIYAPPQHRTMIEKLYANIGVTVKCAQAEKPSPKSANCVMAVKIHALRSLAEMGIIEYGPDTLQAMRQELRKLFADEIQVVELYLNLEDPMTPIVVPELEKMGFIFTGILPETLHGDSLIMQYFNGVHIDYDQLVIVSEVAQELLNYVRRNDPKSD